MSDQPLKTREEIMVWLDRMRIHNYTIRDDLTVDVDGNVDISAGWLYHIPVQFGVIFGDFNCAHNYLTNLKGSPRRCETFRCGHNEITGFEGAPEECKNFCCDNNRLTSLKGIPNGARGFFCRNNQLTSLFGIPSTCTELDCDNNQLTSLDFTPSGCKKLWCSDNQLITLKGIPAQCISVYCRNNPALHDISAAPDGCKVEYDHDDVTRNQAARQLEILTAENKEKACALPRSGRIL